MSIYNIIKQLKLEQNKVVNLESISSELFYYDSFEIALQDANNKSFNNIVEKDKASIVLFGNKDIAILKLLSDITIPESKILEVSNIILDLNGYTLSASQESFADDSLLVVLRKILKILKLLMQLL